MQLAEYFLQVFASYKLNKIGLFKFYFVKIGLRSKLPISDSHDLNLHTHTRTHQHTHLYIHTNKQTNFCLL